MSGGMMVHRASLFSLPTNWQLVGHRLVSHQLPQAVACALGHLAVLLLRPAEVPTELGALHLQANLTGESQLLIGRQLASLCLHRAQLLAQNRQMLGISSHVGNLDLRILKAAKRHGCLERRLHRATPGQRAAAVVNPRQEALLDYIRQMLPAGEPSPLASVCDQLNGCLAIAVFEVLPTQPMTVHPQQQLSLCARDQRHLLGRIRAMRAARAHGRRHTRVSCFSLGSGRHMDMSRRAAPRPPSQFPPTTHTQAGHNETRAFT